MDNSLARLLSMGKGTTPKTNSLADVMRNEQMTHTTYQPAESLRGHDPLTDYGLNMAQRFTNPAAAIQAKAQEFIDMSPQELAMQFAGGGMTGTTSSLGNVLDKWASKGLKIDAYANTSNPNLITLSKIIVPSESRGQGIGTQAMQDLIDTANTEGKTIALSPSSDFGGNKNKLIEWYKSLGFVPNKGKNIDYSISESMYKPPESVQK